MSKRTICLALMLALLLSLGTVTAAAASGSSTIQGADKWNIMLVIDASGSLDHDRLGTTDPQGLRFYAVANFLGTLNDDSANVGAICFTANYSYRDDSPEGMRRAIKCNTGLLPLSDIGTKDYIMDAIDPEESYCVQDDIAYNNAAHNNPALNHQTDIGTAILEAYQTLHDAEEPGRRSAIFLFTDGVTDVIDALKSASQANRDLAVSNISAEGDRMLLCGVYLNGGTSPAGGENEVRDIVCQANGLMPSDMRVNDYYVEINDSRDCVEATDLFLRALGYAIDEESEIITSTTDRTFLVPGVGVLDATIRVYTVDGTPLPKGLEVSFIKPNGQTISGPAANALCFSWSSTSTDKNTPDKILSPISRIYKLKTPDPGRWTVHLDVPEGNEVEIHYSPSFNVDIGAQMTTTPAVADIHANMDVTVKAELTQFGQVLTDPASYSFYECALHRIDMTTGAELPPVPIPNNNGVFEITVSTAGDYGSYHVWVEFTCEQVSAKSEPPEEWRMTNHPPMVSDPDDVKAKVGLFQTAEQPLDLSGNAKDLEDDKDLRFEVVGGSCNISAITQDPPGSPDLIMNVNKIGDGDFTVRVTDSQGASSDIHVNVETENVTLWVVLGLVAALAVLTVIAIKIIRDINEPVIGRCELVFTVGEDRYELEPSVPGSGAYPRHTDMLAIVQSVTRIASDKIDSLKLADVQAFVQEHAAELKAIKVSTVRKEIKQTFTGKKEKVGMLRVRAKGLDKRLYRSNVHLVDDQFDFGFYPLEDDPLTDEGFYGDASQDEGPNTYVQDAIYGDFGGSGSSDSYSGSSSRAPSYGGSDSSSGGYDYDD